MQERTFWGIILGVFILSILTIAWNILSYFSAGIVMAAVTAYIVSPLTKQIHKLGMKTKVKMLSSYTFASLVSLLVLIVPIVLLILQTISFMAGSSGSGLFLDMIYRSPEIAKSIEVTLNAIGLSVFAEIIAAKAREFLLNFAGAASTGVSSFASVMLIQVPVYLIIAYYFIKDGSWIVKSMKKSVPKSQVFLNKLIENIERIAHGLFLGHVVTALIGMILAIIGFMIFGMVGILPFVTLPYAIFLGALCGMGLLLPLVGTPTVFIPIIVWVFYSQPLTTAILNASILIVFETVFLVALPELYLRPNLAGKAGSIHPLIVLLGFIGGPLIWGIEGIVLGPLGLALAHAVFKIYFGEKKNSS
ncbi:AI-2E family transporter [Candidatus Undinarchaeota archaeon]